jgi:hypothetical protein
VRKKLSRRCPRLSQRVAVCEHALVTTIKMRLAYRRRL